MGSTLPRCLGVASYVRKHCDASQCGLPVMPGDRGETVAVPGTGLAVRRFPALGDCALLHRVLPDVPDGPPLLPPGAFNLPTTAEVRRWPGLAVIREEILVSSGSPDPVRDLAMRLDLGRLRAAPFQLIGPQGALAATSVIDPQVVENGLSVLLYFGANPAQQGRELFGAVKRVYELPTGAGDRHLDPLSMPHL